MRAVARVLVVGDFLSDRVPVRYIAEALETPHRTVRTDVLRLAQLAGYDSSTPPVTFKGGAAWRGRERRVRDWRMHLGMSAAVLVRQAVPPAVWAAAVPVARRWLDRYGRWPFARTLEPD